MKKLALLLVLICLTAAAHADQSFDGSVYDAYCPQYDESLLWGWETISYIEPTGLLLSATSLSAELTVSIEESDVNPDVFLRNRFAGVSRYGQNIEGGSVENCVLSRFERAARVNYSYRSLRNSFDNEIYSVREYAAKIGAGYMLNVSLRFWGASKAGSELLDEFMAGFSLKHMKISTSYTAFLTYCESRSDGIYLTLDYCDMEYEPTFGMPYAVNADETAYTCKLSSEAQLWLPELGNVLYSLKHTGPDDTEISIAIENYYNINQVHAVYLVLFNEDGEIIRMQHYNAL